MKNSTKSTRNNELKPISWWTKTLESSDTIAAIKDWGRKHKTTNIPAWAVLRAMRKCNRCYFAANQTTVN